MKMINVFIMISAMQQIYQGRRNSRILADYC